MLGEWLDIYHCIASNDTGCGLGTKPQVNFLIINYIFLAVRFN